jgi:putative NADH-flavin reductase
VRVTVFGATGGIGRQVVDRALAAGHEVHALVRDPSKLTLPDVSVTTGDLADGQAIDRAVEGSDAVIWAVGATQNKADQVELFETAARELVAAMKRHGVRRLVALSGAGITLDGERKPIRGRLMSGLVRLLIRHVVESKRREYLVFRESGLDWTLVRPPRVVEGGPTGHLVASSTLVGARVTWADLAAFMVDQLDDRTYIGRAPYLSS